MGQVRQQGGRHTRREFLRNSGIGIAGITLGAGALAACVGDNTPAPDATGDGQSASGEPIRIGLTNALTGILSVTEKSIWQGAVLAVEEINAAGGINGRPLEAITEDYASDFTIAVQKAEKLVTEDGVAVVIGGYTSAGRLAMLPVFEENNALFLYGTYYEGLECSPSVIYGGAAPNQFLTDYVPWIIENLGPRIYIIGNDYAYPRTVSAIVQKLAEAHGGEILDDRYFPFSHAEFGPTIADIQEKDADVVFSNVVADSTIAFFRQFKNAGLNAEALPIAGTVTTEVEVQAMGVEFAEGHYMTGTYFQSLDNATNDSFVSAYKARFGDDQVTHMPLADTYQMVYLFAEAAKQVGDAVYEADAMREALVGTRLEDVPQGTPYEVFPNHHTSHPSYVGRVNSEGQFDIVTEFTPVEPNPFPPEIVSPDRAPQCPTPLSETS